MGPMPGVLATTTYSQPPPRPHRQPLLHQQHKKTASPWVSWVFLLLFIIALSFTNHPLHLSCLFFLLHLFVEQLNNCGPVSLLLSIHNHQIKSFTALFASLAGLRLCSRRTLYFRFQHCFHGAGLLIPGSCSYTSASIIDIYD